jgi:type IV pilus assembly protein PilC
MLFNYKTLTKDGVKQDGNIESPSLDLALDSLQKRGLMVVSVDPVRAQWSLRSIFPVKIGSKDIVLMSRQIATLFEAKVSVLAAFRLVATESDNAAIRTKISEVTEDIKGGISISAAMSKHPDVFSDFYISMVRSGEESGRLSETFNYLADYLDRTYELVSKAKNALIYPAFVIASFLGVMTLMITYVIPKLSVIIMESGQEIPIYTKIVLGFSNLVTSYWYILLLLIGAVIFALYRYLPTEEGRAAFSRFKLNVPYVGDLYRKLYLSRIADNLNTMIISGVSVVRALEISADVVDNEVYKDILMKSATAIKSGTSISEVFGQFKEIPGIMVQMMKVGEESGKLGYVLETMAKFYRREVDTAVDTLVSLIEPIMIVFLGLGVGILLTSVLVPIYNVASSM